MCDSDPKPKEQSKRILGNPMWIAGRMQRGNAKCEQLQMLFSFERIDG